MVDQLLVGHGITDRKVLDTIRRVPRHLFVPVGMENQAYSGQNLPIGDRQFISNTYIVAFMTQALKLKPTDKVLEVGTGSGYQAAVLSNLVSQVYSIEIVGPLARSASQRLRKLGYKNVQVKYGDGYRGWAEHAPFDAIIVTAAPDHIPEPLVNQLRPGGRLVLPVGKEKQVIKLITRSAHGSRTDTLIYTSFVPMTGEALNIFNKEKN